MMVSARSGYSAAAGPAAPTAAPRATASVRARTRRGMRDLISRPLQDVQPSVAIDEVHEAARVVADVVAAHAPAAGGVGDERGDLARRVRVGDVHEAQAVREPRDGN